MADLDDRLQKLEKVEVKENRVYLTISLDNSELVKEYGGINYQVGDEIRKAVVPVLVEEILKNKDELVAQVLKNVDWPEIVRSEVAQRVIQTIATKSNY